jgi:hypothetical protein
VIKSLVFTYKKSGIFMKKQCAVISLLLLLGSPFKVQAQTATNPGATMPTGSPLTTYPTTTPSSSPSFPTFPSSPASSLLPQWSVGNSGSASYSGSNYGNTNGQFGGGYSGSGSYSNSFSGSGYNFPNQQGACGVSGYIDAVGAKSGAVSGSSNADLNIDAIAGRVGVSFSAQKCIDYLKIDKARGEVEVRKVQASEREISRRRCIEAITETGRMPSSPQAEKAMSNLMIVCSGVLAN